MLLGQIVVDLVQQEDLLVHVKALHRTQLLGPLGLGQTLASLKFLDLLSTGPKILGIVQKVG